MLAQSRVLRGYETTLDEGPGTMDLATMQARAAELATKSDLTSDERNEIGALTPALLKAGQEQAEQAKIHDERETLKQALENSRRYAAEVPAVNRPAMAVQSGSAANPIQVKSFPHIKRADYTVKEITELDYVSLKADGYSEGTIGASTTDAYAKDFLRFCKAGGKNYNSEVLLKSMTEAGDGGVLVPIQWAELITQPPMNTMLRANVRNIPTSVLTQRFPRIKTTDIKYSAAPVAVTWGGETPTSLPDQGTNVKTDQVDITVAEVYAAGDFSISLLEDNVYGLNSYIPQLFQEALDVDLDAKIISGIGTGGANPQPWGFTEAGVVPTVTSATTLVTTYDDLVDLMAKLPQQFRAQGIWLFNSKTWATLSKLKDGQQRPLWQPNLGYIGTTPGGGQTWWDGTLLGRPYIISENMPDAGVGNNYIYYGVYNRAYHLLSRVGATVRILDQVKYTAGCYQFVLRARMGGRVVQPWAIAALKGK